MIGNIGRYLAARFMTDAQIMSRVAVQQRPVHISKHRQYNHNGKWIAGKQTIADDSSIMKRMRRARRSGDGFAEVKLTPARRREHWHAFKRWAWADISKLATDLEKDRERRRLMRYA